MRLLLVEDNRPLADGMCTALKREGHAVEHCVTGAEALKHFEHAPPELLILDLGLPDIDGIDLLATLRGRGHNLPVLILTARDTVADKIVGLDAGADDYLVKPFAQAELFARLRALERRRSELQSSELTVGAVSLSLADHTLFCDGQQHVLSRREFALLKTLMQSPGRIRTREQLEQQLYSWSDEVVSNTIDVHIHNLRKKLPPDFIKTVRGVGYIVERAP